MAYPNSKFVLTVRDTDAWLASCERYWAQAPWRDTRLARARRTVRRSRHLPGPPSFFDYVHMINQRLYGSTRFDAARFAAMLRYYERAVLTYFTDRPGQLLVLDVCGGAGWAPLCDFLAVPRPVEPFPALNAS